MNYLQKLQAAENYIEAINKERHSAGLRQITAGEEDLVFNAFIAGASV